MKNDTLFDEGNTATYCPEDDKLRLYVGRVPREEYEALRNEGWTSTPKQDCDFVAVWTVARKDTAESYAGIILDEDSGPEERAADRAERFAGYLDKRTAEATGHADRYDAGPSAHGYQSKARAVRAADRHDRQADRAVSAWDKAEYWQRRTTGVISSALYKSSPAVRMGRIKTIEAEKRKAEKVRAEYEQLFNRVAAVQADPDAAARDIAARFNCTMMEAGQKIADGWFSYGDRLHPRNPELRAPMYRLMDPEQPDPVTLADACKMWMARNPLTPGTPEYEERSPNAQFTRHCELRLAYELQMLEAQGGRAAMIEMEVGGFLGSFQIRKVNKSPATGRVVSVQVLAPSRSYRSDPNAAPEMTLHTLNIERMAEHVYRAPTAEDKQALKDAIKAEKAAAPKSTAPPLINPTKEDAERLQALWNERAAALYPGRTQDQKPLEMTQEVYSANSSGSYAHCKTRHIDNSGTLSKTHYGSEVLTHAVCKLRTVYGEGSSTCNAYRVIHITDKPAKPLPAATWEAPAPAKETARA